MTDSAIVAPDPTALARVLETMAGLPVVVVGDAVLDVWVEGTATKLCREAPVPVVEEQAVRRAPGGAANIAANLAALGCQVTMVTALGAADDPGADELVAVLAAAGVRVRGPRLAGLQTPVKQRFVADGSIVARVDRGCRPREVSGPVAAELRAVLAEPAAWPGAEDIGVEDTVDLRDHPSGRGAAVVVGDYGLGAAGPEVAALLTERLAGRSPARPCAVVVDAHDPSRWREVGVHAMTPSWPELSALVPVAQNHATAGSRRGWLSDHASEVLDRLGARRVAVTLDRHGAALLSGGALQATAPVPDPVDVPAVGAGDAFTAAYAAGLAVALRRGHAEGERLALALGCAAASLAVRRPGTAVCPREELLAALGSDGPERAAADDELAGVLSAVAAARPGASVVLATGCFDELHRGHVHYLREAREQGDLLVVALNSDRSMTALTQGRPPRQPLATRRAAVERLGLADHVVAFDEASPRELLRRLRPDVVVKGGDYVPEMVPELDAVHEVGAELRTTTYLDLPMHQRSSDVSDEPSET